MTELMIFLVRHTVTSDFHCLVETGKHIFPIQQKDTTLSKSVIFVLIQLTDNQQLWEAAPTVNTCG